MVSEIDKYIKLVLHFLSYRSRTEKEIATYLHRKVPLAQEETIVREVLNYLQQFNLINDTKFCHEFISSRLNKHKGPKIIKLELRTKGIDQLIIDQCLSTVPTSALYQSAKDFILKKSSLIKKTPNRFQSMKIVKILYSRGFDRQTINAVIDDLLS